MNKLILNACTLILIGVSNSSYAQDPGTREWETFVDKFIPEQLRSPSAVNDLLTGAKPGKPFSTAFNPTRAQTVFVDKLDPDKECYFDKRPNGELPQEECNSLRGSPLGTEPAAIMTYNMGDGSVRYLNRGRDPKASLQAKLTRAVAADALKKMAEQLGLPLNELGPIEVQDLLIAGNPAEAPKVGALGTKPAFEQRVGVFGIIARCIPVTGQAINSCIPVVDGGIRAALVDGSRREPAVVPAWFEARFNTFEIPSGLKPLLVEDIKAKIAGKLARDTKFGSLDRLDIKLAYATQAELAGQEGDVNCSPSEADEKDGDPSSATTSSDLLPANLIAERSYLPAVQVFALPIGWDRSITIDPDKVNDISTGISVFTIPLAQADPSECQADSQ
jgi:hypothetical protein